MTGICMSMRIRSKGSFMARSAPMRPFSAIVTSAPALCSTKPMSFRLVSPSSTTRIRTPASEGRASVDFGRGLRMPSAAGASRIFTPSKRPRGNRHCKRAALADFAGDADSAAQGLCNPAADRQPQAGAAELAGHGSVGLNERIEDGLELVGGDADARIDHLHHKLRIDLVLDQLGTNLHFSRRGELDGVAHQVHQQLPEARRIGADGFRHSAVPVVVQRQVLFQGLDPQHGDDFADDFVRRAADLLDLQAVGLDLRQVEDVIDQSRGGVFRWCGWFAGSPRVRLRRTGCRSSAAGR